MKSEGFAIMRTKTDRKSNLIRDLEKYINGKRHSSCVEDRNKLQCAENLLEIVKNDINSTSVDDALHDIKHQISFAGGANINNGKLRKYLQKALEISTEYNIDESKTPLDLYIDEKLSEVTIKHQNKKNLLFTADFYTLCSKSGLPPVLLQFKAAKEIELAGSLDYLKQIMDYLKLFDQHNNKTNSNSYSPRMKNLIRQQAILLARKEIEEAESVEQLDIIEAQLKTIYANSSAYFFSGASAIPPEIKAEIKSKKQEIKSPNHAVSTEGCGDVEMCVTSPKLSILPS